jgi:peptidoglycan/LPS O-acetylase OafA/YrhL
MRNWIYVFVVFVLASAPIFLFVFVGHIDTQQDFGIVRCVLGFFVGFLCYDLHLLIMRTRTVGYGTPAKMTLVEIACMCLIIAFICFLGEASTSLLAPVVFGIAVLAFSFEGGAVSAFLRPGPFVLLGTLSYSIYMTHAPVEIGMRYVLQVAEKAIGITLFSQKRIGAEMWQGDLAYLAALCLVVGVSCLTYKFIEQPGRQRSRKIADTIFPANEVAGHAVRPMPL